MLGIIGLIADMTIPTLINNVAEKAALTQLKKVYSVISQATTLASIENGQPDDWEIIDGSTPVIVRLFSYYKPFLNILRECENKTGCWENTKYLKGTSAGSMLGANVYTVTLNDGVNIMFDVFSTTYYDTFGLENENLYPSTLVFFVDVNGGKKPNQYGRDIFIFILTKKGIVPAGIKTAYDCNTSGNGYTCAAKVLNENAINY